MDNFREFSEQLKRDGFFIWKQLLDHQLIDHHLAAFEDLNRRLGVEANVDFHSYPSEKQTAIKEARYRFHAEQELTQRLIFNPRLLAFLTELFGQTPVMRQPETGFYTRNTPDHTDSLDFKVEPHGAEVRMWCALEDIHPDSGPVYFVPGSHEAIAKVMEQEVFSEQPQFADLLRSQMGATTATQFFEVTRPMWRYVRGQKLPRAILEKGLERQVHPLRKGDVVIFSSDVVHGTCRCNNSQLTRKYLVAYWAAKNARWYHSRSYWGPMHDFRSQENAITAPVELTEFGYRMHFQELHAAYMASFEKPVAISDRRQLAVE
jgi:ectoine hydroxylase-related dioxygenase (phytanoyl-CoA dioxygenase family)